jgi:hypothetical protein
MLYYITLNHLLELTREYHFYNIETGMSLNIWARRKEGRVNPNYTHEDAREKILDFIKDAEYLIAYEPPSNDRNRLKSLLGDEIYTDKIQTRVVDFKRELINALIKTEKSQEILFIYLPGRTQPDIYKNLLQVGALSYPKPENFLSIPDSWKKNIDMKCQLDVYLLHNLFVYFKSVLD